MNLLNKVAIISGGTGALGTAVTRTILNAGANVIVLYTRASGLEAMKNKLASGTEKLDAIKTNVLDQQSIKSMVDNVLENHEKIDILINLVGGFLGGHLVTDTSEEQWDKMMHLNAKSAFLCCRYIVPVMKKQQNGRIVTIGGRGALSAVSGMAAYSAAKAALISLTQTLAVEGRDDNITANVVIPSIIDTAENRNAMPDANFDNWVRPEIIAETILFLCSERSSDISGAIIPIYGKS